MPFLGRGLIPTIGFGCLLAWSCVAATRPCQAQQWVDARVAGPFVCRAEFPLGEYAGLLGELVQIQADLTRCLGIPPARQPIDLYLFRDQASYERFLKQRLPDVAYRRALYVKSQGSAVVLAYQSRELATDVRHECTHALLHAVLPVVPLWLDEGLAEFFEVPRQQRAFDNPHLRALRWNLWLGSGMTLEELEKQGDWSKMGRTEYKYSWAWVHFLLYGPKEAHAELVRYLADIQAATPPGDLSQRLKRRVPSLQRRFAAHIRSWKR